MKKTKMVTKVLLVTLTIFAAVATFSSCSKGNAYGDEAIWQANVTERHIGPVEGSYANGLVMFRCIDSFWVDYMGETYPATHYCNSQYVFEGGSDEEIAALNGCYELDTNTNQILGTSLTLTFLRDEIEEALVTLIGNTDPTDFRTRFNKCHIGARSVCINPDEHTIVFKGVDENGDTAFARGRWYGVITDTITDTTYITDTITRVDTVVVVRNDTVFVIEYDTTLVVDTITNDTTYYVVDSVVQFAQHISEWNGAMVGNTLKFGCYNKLNIIDYRNGVIYSTNAQNFSGHFDYQHSETGTYRTTHVGMALPIAADGTVNWGNGYSEVFTHQPHYTTPSGYEAWLRYLDCDFILDSVYGQSNGILVAGHYVCPNGNHRKTLLIPKTPTTPTDTTTRRIIGRDTAWNGCGHRVNSTVGSVTVTHLLAKTGTETINYNLPPLTETHTVTCSTAYYDQWYVSGLANPASIGSTANFSGNTLSIGGATLTITPGTHHWCPLTYISGELTANGILVTVSYNGQTGTVLFPVPFDNPEPIFTSVLAAVATDTYTHQIFSLSSYRHTYVCVVAQIGTNYRFYWAELQAGLTRADFDSVSITATEANFYVNHLADGYYPAMVCSHSDHTTLYRGVVKSEELTTGWQQTYRLAPSNDLAYVMGGSSWTMAGDNGRSAIRGIMNSTGTITADGIIVQIIPSMP